jgi:hypothetical protein
MGLRKEVNAFEQIILGSCKKRIKMDSQNLHFIANYRTIET